jgi:protease IV
MHMKSLLFGILGATIVFTVFLVSIMSAKLLLGDGTMFSEAVGVIRVQGPIEDAAEFITQLKELQDNKAIKAIVLRIDSPGGVVGPSQEMYAEVKKCSQKKPLIVSMGSVAASGGYYIAAPANVIFANPGTITGSIGVIIQLTNIQGLLDKVGLKSAVLKSGRFKDSGSPVRPLTEEDKAVLQSVVDSMHRQFIKAVAEGRKLPLATVRELADGRIFSGEQAHALKLVDRLGTMEDAISEAARRGGIKGKPKVIYPVEKSQSLLDLLASSTAQIMANKLHSERAVDARFQLVQ